MSYDDWKRSPWQDGNSYGDTGAPEQPGHPGKRTLTLNLPPRAESTQASAEIPAQRKADPAVVRQRKQQSALTEQWMDAAVRPDLHAGPVQHKEADGGEQSSQEPSSLPADGGGQAMPEDVRARMEGAFGADFSGVRVHEGSQATAMGALAYTQGNNIHFAPGQYQPGSQSGQELLGHELTHVVQQSQGRVSATTQNKGVGVNDDSALEREADEMGAKAARGESIGGRAAVAESGARGAPAAGTVQKKTDGTQGGQQALSKPEAFVQKYAASAAALENKDGIPALFTLAQGALESGWGEKAIGNALFGIKTGSSWTGKKQLVTTTEYFSDDKQGSKFPEVISITKVGEKKYKYIVKDYFRDYDTVEEGLADHSSFLMTNKRYAPAFNTETPEAFAQAVADAGYATASGYGGTLKSMIASVKKRWPKDLPMPAGNAKAKTGGKPGGAKPETGTEPPAHTEPGDKPPQTGDGGQTTPPSGAKSITASVGDKGANKPDDALVIKELMIKAGYDLTMIPAVGPKTIAFIKDFQRKTLGWKNPDGLIEPGGKTFTALAGGATAPKAPQPTTPVESDQPAGSVGNKLDEFYTDFSNIKVVHGDKTVIVKPPYHINSGNRRDAALQARADNPKVNSFINKLVSNGEITANAKVGKSQPSDLKVILEAAVNEKLVTHEASAMFDFLAKYGLSVDCSGYVSQALDFLMDGNKVQDKGDALKPENTGSGSLAGGTANFTKVDIADVVPGDTMHLSGHIRIINEVVREDKTVFFRTTESTAAVNPENQMNGMATRWWKWDGKKKYTTWKNQNSSHPAADDKGWKASNESNTFGRYKKLNNANNA